MTTASSQHPEGDALEGVAIIGASLRFPGARTLDEFWRNLVGGVESIRRYDAAALHARGIDPSWLADPHFVPVEAAPEDIDRFDADFFGYSPREAQLIDPQQRIMLECAWEALESAGIRPSEVADGVGVFTAGAASTYLSTRELFANQAGTFYPILLGNALDYLASRIAYKLGFHGPAITAVGACAGSLATVHLACQSLLSGECDLALAGGVSIRCSEVPGYFYRVGGPSSPDGHCRAFDAAAGGTVFGNGAGLVVLKRAAEALRDGDTIYAVIRGSALGNDGARKSGFSAPSADGQAQVIAEALAVADVRPDALVYVEAHGTGTQLGDPIEVQGLRQVFAADTARRQFCALGAAKTNIGHLDAAAGVVGLIKTALVLHHRVVPPSLHFREANPHIDFASSPFYVPTEPRPLPEVGPLFAGVSSFGMGGANAHLLLTSAPQEQAAAGGREALAARGETPRDTPLGLLTISAKTEAALLSLAQGWVDRLAKAEAGNEWSSLWLGAGREREPFEHRLAIVADSSAQAEARLREAIAGDRLPPLGEHAGVIRAAVGAEVAPKVALLFSGQGAQRPGMGRALYAAEPVFRATLDRCARLFDRGLDRPLCSLLFDEGEDAAARLRQTGYAQPALFAFELALAELWRAWGLRPAMVLGHSVGEIAAACFAGALSLEDGAQLVLERARRMQALPPGGAMAAVATSEAELRARLSRLASELGSSRGEVTIAAVNAPTQCVLSGDHEAIEVVLAIYEAEGVRVRRLTVSHGFHSSAMDPMLDGFEAAIAGLAHAAPTIPLVSNLDGAVIDRGGVLGPRYWRRQLREAVRFAAGVSTLRARGCDTFVEVGPGSALVAAGRACVEELAQTEAGPGLWLPSLRTAELAEPEQLFGALARLYAGGVALDWSGLSRGHRPRRVSLPTYPFARDRHWLDLDARRAAGRVEALPTGSMSMSMSMSGAMSMSGSMSGSGSRATASAAARQSPLLTPEDRPPTPSSLGWRGLISLERFPYLADHRIHGRVIFPAAAHIEVALAGAAALLGPAIELEDLTLRAPMLFEDEGPRALALTLDVRADAEADAAREQIDFRLESRAPAEAAASLHVSGGARRLATTPASAPVLAPGDDDLALDVAAHYAGLEAIGLQYGPRFRGVEAAWRRGGKVVGRVRLPAVLIEEAEEAEPSEDALGRYRVHPVLLDACFQLLLLPRGGEPAKVYMPFGVDSLRYHGGPPIRAGWCEVEVRPAAGGDTLTADLRLCDDAQRVVLEIEGLVARPTRVAAPDRRRAPASWFHHPSWQPWQPKAPAAADPGRWLILGPADEARSIVAAALTRLGVGCALVDPAELERVDSSRAAAVVDLRPLTLTVEAAASGQELQERLRPLIEGSLAWLRAQADSNANSDSDSDSSEPGPRLWLITRGAQDPATIDDPGLLAQASLWGLGRVIANEHPALWGGLVDLDPGEPLAQGLEALAEVLVRATREAVTGVAERDDQLRRREGRWQAARLSSGLAAPTQAEAPLRAPAVGEGLRLTIAAPGSVEGLRYQAARRRAPGPGEVEVEVTHVSLNFLDLLKVLGQYPGPEAEALALASECAGVVCRRGPGVEDLAVGDQVLCAATGCFASHLCLAADAVRPSPESLTPADAAGFLSVFMTAHYALDHLARLRPGERVLIHSAAGGTGLAAIQVARRLGAEVFATAGTEEKRAYLREQLGIEHVFDSRSLAFAEALLAATGGEGVDVVLNSLAGEAIAAGMSTLRHHGRFIELGKRDIHGDGALALAPFRRSLGYFAVDLAAMPTTAPARFRQLADEVLAGLAAGVYTPLPKTVYPAAACADAFRLMSRGGHIGKLVIAMAERDGLRVTEAPASAIVIPRDGAVLITGGLGGLGLAVADWLADRGVRSLILLGRSQPSAAAQARLDALRERGVAIELAFADVADEAALAGVFAQRFEADGERAPLRGVVHAAGVLDDGVLIQQRWDRFSEVLAPKLAGAWNLHRLTRGMDLALFVLFSSGAGLLGMPAQGNYAAANAALDALAHARRAAGLPGLAIDWGGWAEVGMAAGVGDRLERRGLQLMAPSQALDALGRALDSGATQLAVMAIDWRSLLATLPATGFLAEQRAGARPTGARPARGLAAQLAREADPAGRIELLRELVTRTVGRILAIEVERLPVDKPLMELGLDSLLAIELRGLLQGEVGPRHVLPTTLLFRYPTIEAIVAWLAALLGVAGPGDAGEVRDGDAWSGDAEGEVLDEDEAAAQLERELEALANEGLFDDDDDDDEAVDDAEARR